MAISHSTLRFLSTHYMPNRRSPPNHSPNTSVLISRTKSQFAVHCIGPNRPRFQTRNQASVRTGGGRDKTIPSPESIRRWVGFAGSFMPGGSWWSLCEREDDQVVVAKPLTVVFALRRLWALLGDDKWIMYAAFGAVIITAVSSLLLIEQQ